MSLKVLIADDEELIRELITETIEDLEGVGQIFEAENGVEALEVIQSENIGLIISDIKMPRMMGDELLRQLKGRIPAIVITGHGDDGTEDRLKKLGAVGFVYKPFDYAEIRATVTAALAKQKDQQTDSAKTPAAHQ